MNDKLRTVGIIILSSLAITACSPSAEQTGKDTKELVFYASDHPWVEAIKPLLPEFESKTGIKVKLEMIMEEKLTSKLKVPLTGEWPTPDVFMYRPLQEGMPFAYSSWMEPLDPYAAEESFGLADFYPSALGSATMNNKLYGIPVVTEQQVLYYRKDLLQKAGLKVPSTIEELAAAAGKLHDPKHGVHGFVARGQQSALVTQLSSFIYSEGGDFQDGYQATLQTPEAMKAYRTYGELLRQYAPAEVTKWSWPQAMSWFASGKAALYTDASSLYKNAIAGDSVITETIGYAPFPAGSAGSRPYNLTAWVLGINSYSKHKEEAWAFIKWAASKETVMATQQKGVPGARESVWSSKEGTSGFPVELAEAIRASSGNGVGHDRPVVVQITEARNAVGSIVQAVMNQGDVEAAAHKADETLQHILDQEKQLAEKQSK
jgi:multiple sugar transport system substrate-binding protein